MAVTECKLLRGRTATITTRNRNVYAPSYRIITDSNMSERDVYAGAVLATPDPLPQLWQAYTSHGWTDLGSLCLSIAFTQSTQDRFEWIARCAFGQPPEGQEPEDNVLDPLQRPVKYRIEWLEESEVIEKDRDGEPITNTVGDEFVPGLEQPKLYPVLVCTKNYATYQEILDIGIEYHQSVNEKTFANGEPGTVKLLPVESSELRTERGIRYYTGTLRFAYNPDTWIKAILNRGWRGRLAAGEAIQKLTDKENNLPITQPANLDANGVLLQEGQPVHYVERWTLKEKDYSDLDVL